MKAYRAGGVVIKQSASWRLPVMVVILLLLVATGVGLYELGKLRGDHDAAVSGDELLRSQQQLERLGEERGALSAKIALLERSTQVDGEAYAKVRDELAMLQAENLELREELAFYRSIVAPKESGTALRVQQFELKRAGEGDVYHYRLIATQVLKKSALVRGRVEMRLKGVVGAETKLLKLEEVALQSSGKHNFKFRYFEKFEGDFKLPEGFVPQSVEIELIPTTKGRDKASSSYDWDALVG
ncbi:hypothetical protein BOW53_08410 [Solemya pervernicosa gill symbiont]|uniref:Uncharacterized protein n=2 Tax=Gammaproteobacteria incertae sedis TaxID=118884 RepID=A0A1T2L562_9GAMM|nr:DUF6776 family protein [Candidatus Reidiella endopervernicosa]OOZ40258.1 hypothetical protein BOW53_08410 [Solemya pervernicosa gill symbiont]QKQ26046.1 hypothetical protein HUE57_06910 [Candidatus Reidiella endopervernicosa]